MRSKSEQIIPYENLFEYPNTRTSLNRQNEIRDDVIFLMRDTIRFFGTGSGIQTDGDYLRRKCGSEHLLFQEWRLC